MNTENVARLSLQIIEQQTDLPKLSDADMQKTLGPGLWSGKELLGHLSDSAAINRQRIVRSQYEELSEFPLYDQPKWVRIQSYHNYPWADLVTLYLAEYQHLLHMLENLPGSSASNKVPVTFGSSDYVTLDWLVGHMFRHNDHHLRQIYWLAGLGDLPDDRKLSQPIADLPHEDKR